MERIRFCNMLCKLITRVEVNSRVIKIKKYLMYVISKLGWIIFIVSVQDARVCS